MTLRIYIAASWKHQHAVEMLTALLRSDGHEVLSFVENQNGEQAAHLALREDGSPVPFDEWVWSERGWRSFEYDTQGAGGADLVIYIGPSGMDAAAEVGIAWASGVPVVGLFAKGEQFGLMRRLVHLWFVSHTQLLDHIRKIASSRSAA